MRTRTSHPPRTAAKPRSTSTSAVPRARATSAASAPAARASTRPSQSSPTSSWRSTAGLLRVVVVRVREDESLHAAQPQAGHRGSHHALAAVEGSVSRPPASTRTAPPPGPGREPRAPGRRPGPDLRPTGTGGGGPSAAHEAEPRRGQGPRAGPSPVALRQASARAPASARSSAGWGRGTWSAPHGTAAVARAPAGWPPRCTREPRRSLSQPRDVGEEERRPPVPMMQAQAGAAPRLARSPTGARRPRCQATAGAVAR
jgi:hypothetical protein